MAKKIPALLQIAVLLIGFLLISGPVHSENLPKMYGKDSPFKIEDLPPNSRLRLDLENLSPEIRAQAMKRLHEISFPAEDVDSLRVNSKGQPYYEEHFPQPIDRK